MNYFRQLMGGDACVSWKQSAPNNHHVKETYFVIVSFVNQIMHSSGVFLSFFLFFFLIITIPFIYLFKIFIYLAMPDLVCPTWDF